MNALPESAAVSAPDPRPRAALESLGCRLNHAETELIRQGLERAGYRIVPWGEPADVMVLNSCTVTAEADATSRQTLRRARRVNPGARLAVVGCHAQLHAEALAAEGLADVIVGNGDKLAVVEQLKQPVADAPTGAAEGAPAAPRIVRAPLTRAPFTLDFDPAASRSADGGTRAHLKIQDGCDFMCTFCIIPKARGRARPRALDNLLAEARALAERGAREIVLTGVNLGTFAAEGCGLTEVVDRLDALPGLARVRISSIEPTTVDAGLLERMADPGHALAPFLHLPLQSGSDAVLTAMRRRYSAAQYAAFAERALAAVPDLCLGADVMAGFPGEDDAAFAETFGLIERLPFAYLHVFGYSPRPGTPAARMAPLPAPLRDRRVAALRALSEAKRLAFHRRFLGREVRVLFEKPRREDIAEGYTEHYVRVRAPAPGAALLRNRILPVRLIEAGAQSVAGEIVQEVEALPSHAATLRRSLSSG
jgi:threonylcarbamoyladenosine tRNA methylthiotransferase MtaB